MTPDLPAESDPVLQYRRDSRRLNVILAGLALLATGWTVYGTSFNVRRFTNLEQYFGGMKIPLPAVTIAVYDHNVKVLLMLCILALSCAAATLKQRERWETSLLNIAGVVIPLAWWIFHTAVWYDVAISILEGVGSRAGR